MSQYQRAQLMWTLKSGSSRIIISTDLLSIGIDVQQISLVLNYDLPFQKDCHNIHRIGISGRFAHIGLEIIL